jgi:hypothetical protein
MPEEPSVQKQNKGINLLPVDGFSLVVDGKLKTHYASAEPALKEALELKAKFPALQIMVRDNATGIRTPVEAEGKVIV